jgi:hypothetical protein
MISPLIFMLFRMEPSQLLGAAGGDGGVTSAIGSPFRVTRMVSLVLFASRRRLKQVALNSEIGMVSSMTAPCICENDIYASGFCECFFVCATLRWSTTIVNKTTGCLQDQILSQVRVSNIVC